MPPSSINLGQANGKVICILIAVIGVGLGFVWQYIIRPPDACDLTSVSHRDFDHYYGLVNIDNPLSHYNAEQAGSLNRKCHLFYDHLHLFSTTSVSLTKSMIIQALRGSGKTQIRQCIIARLPYKNHILIKIYGADINSYLDHFVKNIDITSEPPYEKIRKYWTKEHFLQVILTEIASRFINENFFSVLKKNRDAVSLQTRKEVASLISFYSTKYSDTLCTIINLLLHELTECFWSDCSIPCDNHHFTNGDPDMFIALTERHRKIKVKRQTTATDASLRLLLAMYTKTKYSPLPCLDRSYRDQLALLIDFLNTLHVTTTVIVDSLDESAFFFDKADTSLDTLQTFIDSVTNDEILYLALGNWADGIEISNSFAFYIFIPKTPATPMKISWTRPDKIPVIELKWDELQLINYADYVFDYLRSKSRFQCKTLPDICSLLGGEKLCIDSIKQLRHPRDFHIFFDVLTRHMSTVCTQRDPPFNATQKDLSVVLAEAKQRMLSEKVS